MSLDAGFSNFLSSNTLNFYSNPVLNFCILVHFGEFCSVLIANEKSLYSVNYWWSTCPGLGCCFVYPHSFPLPSTPPLLKSLLGSGQESNPGVGVTGGNFTIDFGKFSEETAGSQQRHLRGPCGPQPSTTAVGPLDPSKVSILPEHSLSVGFNICPAQFWSCLHPFLFLYFSLVYLGNGFPVPFWSI